MCKTATSFLLPVLQSNSSELGIRRQQGKTPGPLHGYEPSLKDRKFHHSKTRTGSQKGSEHAITLLVWKSRWLQIRYFETGQILWNRQTSNLINWSLHQFLWYMLWLEENEGVFISSSFHAILKECQVIKNRNAIATEWINTCKRNLPINTCNKC